MDIAYDGTHIVFKNLTGDVPITIQTTQVKTTASIDSTDGSIFNTDSKTLTTADNKLLFVTYGAPEPEPEPEKDAHLIELFESFTISRPLPIENPFDAVYIDSEGFDNSDDKYVMIQELQIWVNNENISLLPDVKLISTESNRTYQVNV